MSGIVYVLTNPAMRGHVKIGRTTQKNFPARLRNLYSTNVPEPFQCEYAVLVEDALRVERALHDAFYDQRPNSRREFFVFGDDAKVGAERVRAVLKLLVDMYGAKDVTPKANEKSSALNAKEKRKPTEKPKKGRRKRAPINFDKMKIPRGAELVFARGGKEKTDRVAKVIGAKKVLFEGEEKSLTQATKLAMGVDWSPNPTPHWYYKKRLLQDIWEQWTESEGDVGE